MSGRWLLIQIASSRQLEHKLKWQNCGLEEQLQFIEGDLDHAYGDSVHTEWMKEKKRLTKRKKSQE